MSRIGAAERSTAETTISIRVDLDGTGQAEIATPIGLLDHLLTLLARHSLLDLTVRATGEFDYICTYHPLMKAILRVR